jgi:hypothetical protein
MLHAECACGHVEQLTGAMLGDGGREAGSAAHGIERRLRCRERDQRAQVIVTVKSHDAPTRPLQRRFTADPRLC